MSVTTEQLKVDLGDHAVHFYRHGADLADTVGRYLTDALGELSVTVVIATEPHVMVFERQLAASGADVEGALESGRLIFLDAAATLAKLSVGGQIDGGAFDNEVGRLLRGAAEGGGAVRVYGEMVDLLWQAGDIGGAIELERLWCELIDELRFSLLCAYHSATAAAPEHEHALREVCRLHSRVSSASGADPFQGTELAALYLRVADTLERSAQLAEQHAQRYRGASEHQLAAIERERIELERAQRGRMAVARGRALASRLRSRGTQ